MPRLFTVASDSSLAEQIASAKDRLIIVAPGLSREVAAALASRIAADGGPPVLAVILDVDPEVCRLGYGDIEAVDLILPALASRGLGLQTQKGVRIGLTIADEEILVYTPTPRLIEAGSTSEQKPNAIRITEQGATDLARACGGGTGKEFILSQEVGLDFVKDADVRKTKADLQEVPPRRFDLARLERVFNYRLEYVEFSIEHYKLDTRSVRLDPEILGLAEPGIRERFRNTFRVFQAGGSFRFTVPHPAKSEESIELTEKWLSDKAAALRKDYFIPLGSSYGNLIQKRRKPEFENGVAQLRALVDLYAVRVRETIATEIAVTRGGLIAALLPRVKAAPPRSWLSRTVDGRISDADLRARLEQVVDEAFASVEQSFEPTLTCVFKGVSYETITEDPHFRKKIEGYFGPEGIRKLLEEHDSSPGQPTQPSLFPPQ
jgi:hypothetical protein